MKRLFLFSAVLLSAIQAQASPLEKVLDEPFIAAPSNGGARFRGDEEQYELGKILRKGPAGEDARIDADLYVINERFSEAAGFEISKKKTPALYELMNYPSDRLHYEIHAKVKAKHGRQRPYVYHHERTCYREDEAPLAGNGSYPSGHSAAAWMKALILAELIPGRAYELIRHGYEVGQGRVVCGYHWQSDVDDARLMAAAYLAVVRNDPKFRKLFGNAKKELAGIRPNAK